MEYPVSEGAQLMMKTYDESKVKKKNNFLRGC